MTTPPSVEMPTLSETPRAALTREIEHCPPATLRLILASVCDQNATVAQALHYALCIDARPPPSTMSVNAVIDLTEDPDSDAENVAIVSKKRKAPSDFSDVANETRNVGARAPIDVSWKDRYVHCSNCYELFDVVENEQEKNEGIPRPPRTSDEQGLDEHDPAKESAPAGSSGSSVNSGNCIYHDGFLDPNYEDDFWADHDDCHGDIDSMELRNSFPEGYTWKCCGQLGDVDGCKTAWHQADGMPKFYAQLQKAR